MTTLSSQSIQRSHDSPLHPMFEYSPSWEKNVNFAKAACLILAQAVSIIALAALSGFALEWIAASRIVTGLISIGIFMGIVTIFDPLQKALDYKPYAQKHNLARLILDQEKTLDRSKIYSRLDDLGISVEKHTAAYPHDASHLLARYDVYNNQERNYQESAQSLQDRLNSSDYDQETHIDDIFFIKHAIEISKENAAKYRLKQAYILKVIGNPFVKDTFKSYFSKNTKVLSRLSPGRKLAYKFNKGPVTTYIETKNRSKYTTDQVLNTDIIKLSRDVFESTLKSGWFS